MTLALAPALLLLACAPQQGAAPAASSPVYGLWPDQGGQGTTLTLDLEATVASFAAGATALDLGEGITVEGVEVDDGWRARATVRIAEDARLGARDATLAVDGAAVVLPAAFQVRADSFTLSPDQAWLGETVAVQFQGKATSWTAGRTWPSFGDGVEVVEFTVLDEETATGRVTVDPGATPGWRDVELQEGAEGRLVLPDGFLVDRAAVLGALSPSSAEQGQTLSFSVEGWQTAFDSGQTTVSFHDAWGPANDVLVDSVTVVDSNSLVGQLTVSSGAVVGSRDLQIQTGTEGLVLPDAFTVLAAPFALEDVAVDLRFSVDRDVDNATGAVEETVTASCMFYTPLQPACPLPELSGGELGSPQRYDLPESFGIDASTAATQDCPTPRTWGAGEVVWLEADDQLLTLERVEDDSSGLVYYRAQGLALADYVLGTDYDLRTQGEEGQVGAVLVEGVQPTVPADWSLLSPTLWGNHSHDRARDFCFQWTPAQTYPDAVFISTIWSRSEPGPLVEEGWVGYVGAVPWDDGDFCFEAAQLSVLAPGTVPLSFYAFQEGPAFGLPGSSYQDNQASTWIRLRASMVLQ